MPRFTVEKIYGSQQKVTFKVSGGKPGAEPVSVRVGKHGVFACLTCHSVGCAHVAAAIAHDESTSATPRG